MTADLMTTYTAVNNADQCAQAGLDWLRTEGPKLGFKWTRINLKELDIASTFDCALAQAANRNYSYALDVALAHEHVPYENGAAWAGKCGFNGRYVSNVQLNRAWKKAIRAARPWWKKPLNWVGR